MRRPIHIIIIVHLADAVNKGYKKIYTVDTDVVVLAVAAAAKVDIENRVVDSILVQPRVSVTYT